MHPASSLLCALSRNMTFVRLFEAPKGAADPHLIYRDLTLFHGLRKGLRRRVKSSSHGSLGASYAVFRKRQKGIAMHKSITQYCGWNASEGMKV